MRTIQITLQDPLLEQAIQRLMTKYARVGDCGIASLCQGN